MKVNDINHSAVVRATHSVSECKHVQKAVFRFNRFEEIAKTVIFVKFDLVFSGQ